MEPATLGTTTCSTPLDTIIVTGVPGLTDVPAPTDWLITCPAATVSLDCKAVLTLKPESVIAFTAESLSLPTTFGTVIICAPLDTTMSTVEFFLMLVPGVSDWLITCPAATVSLYCSSTINEKPAFLSAASADARSLPITLGTAKSVSPLLTTSATLSPFLAALLPVML